MNCTTTDTNQLRNSGHGVCEYMRATHSSQHTAPDAKHSSTRCCPTHEMWELPTPLIVANISQQGDEVRELPTRPLTASWVPSNTYLTPAKPNTITSSGTVTQKPRIGSYKLYPSLSYPSNTTEGSKQSIRTYTNRIASPSIPTQHWLIPDLFKPKSSLRKPD
ncbi:hypothetical protein F511_02971 [Dorcoceras hygrometricum]|uniref:Uncharacterized protein n=1 Tax=Dorcoceras hygrometricum TaxID=472368 RepID=A0A2Z7BSU9_9LAMI|nr:hypothetical protein F511_02971 [Dorcoceras hygrometricum]